MTKITKERLEEIRNACKVIGTITDEEMTFFHKLIAHEERKNQPNVNIIVSKPKTYEKVTEFLNRLGVFPNLNGCDYLYRAIVLRIEASDPKYRKMSGLYEKIAEEYNTTYSRVERGIRYCISKVWKTEGCQAWQREFRGYVSINNPNNSQTIALMAEYLK